MIFWIVYLGISCVAMGLMIYQFHLEEPEYAHWVDYLAVWMPLGWTWPLWIWCPIQDIIKIKREKRNEVVV